MFGSFIQAQSSPPKKVLSLMVFHKPFCCRFGEEMRPVKLTTKVFGIFLSLAYIELSLCALSQTTLDALKKCPLRLIPQIEGTS